MKHISLFSGIGGFDLAAEWVGWTNVASCEIGDFGHKILSYYWSEAYHHRDIHDLTYDKLNHEISKRHGENWRTDGVVLSGGFPCQPYSTAGKRKGKEDDRHLWPEMLRLVREIRPDYIVGENVHGIVNWNGGLVFDEVQSDLEDEGYEVIAVVLPAASVGAPHRRDRVWFVAYSNKISRQSMGERKNEIDKSRQKKEWSKNRNEFYMVSDGDTFKIKQHRGQVITRESALISDIDGLSQKLDRITFCDWADESNRAYGNAVVPQVVFEIFKVINQLHYGE